MVDKKIPDKVQIVKLLLVQQKLHLLLCLLQNWSSGNNKRPKGDKLPTVTGSYRSGASKASFTNIFIKCVPRIVLVRGLALIAIFAMVLMETAQVPNSI